MLSHWDSPLAAPSATSASSQGSLARWKWPLRVDEFNNRSLTATMGDKHGLVSYQGGGLHNAVRTNLASRLPCLRRTPRSPLARSPA
ncbi:hypothetical protein CBOM_07705 [Ceraceosorus bombacis]|uniref:Uncharacterized protein n=1 Tax=Ceraceosorus bombacis TaxID=401625 RepID=A0A0N7LA10_9BASI|nr:hypothetical protein CBOM_07705 [Ceraceosorus bombacis]